MSFFLSFFHNNLFISLTELPDEPRIFDAQGKEVANLAGPFREGHELFLSCQVTGGKLFLCFLLTFDKNLKYVQIKD